MKGFVVGAGMTVLLGVAGLAMYTGAQAQSAPAAFSQCAVVQVPFAATPADAAKFKTEGNIPAGWTPIGGGAVPKGMKYVGVVTVCR